MLDVVEMDQLKAAIQKSIAQSEISGCNLMVIKEGEEVFYHEDGLSDMEANIPISRDSIFRLYSMSKPVTGLAAMILMERGLIDLYEPVSKFLPGFMNQMVDEGGELKPVLREVTIKDLLSMTSGLVYPGDGNLADKGTAQLFTEADERLLGSNPMSTMEIMNELGKCPLAFQPGILWRYGTSADVMGAVIEAVSGISFGEFLEKEIFKPLDMKDTAFYVPEEKRYRLVKTYQNDGGGGLKHYTGNNLAIIGAMDRKPAFESGGAGLVSTIDDYSRFTKMLMNGGQLDGVRIIRSATYEYFINSTLTEEQRRGYDWSTLSGYNYGNLMRIMTDPDNAAGMASPMEYGWDGWLGAYFTNCPKDDLTILFMTNKTDAGTMHLTRKLRNIILSSFRS
ncbi:MAG: beta-lactamase [Anaerocolumna sp.]|jgi:CubicO group peptidase (beta-lactamase class C family)|nr:beta-lactamase [Anaerocolumna sp.]